MKIVWISHDSQLEGAERCLLEALVGLVNKCEEIHVIVPRDGKLVPEIIGTTKFVHHIPYSWWTTTQREKIDLIDKSKQYISTTLKFIRLLKLLQPDIVVTNTLTIPWGAFAAKTLGIKHIWYIHEFLKEDHGLMFELWEPLSLFLVDKLSDRLIVNSQAVFNKFSRYINQSKLRKALYSVDIPNVAELIDLWERDKNIFYISLIGRKAPSKGQKEAIEALAYLIKQKEMNVHLSLVGSEFDQDYVENLKNRVQELGIKGKVDFIPFVHNPLVYTKSSDIVLMCSQCEAFGRVTVEAMKLGKSVIASNSGATPEIIEDGWNGLLYEPGNPVSLAEKIELLYKNKELREKLEVNAFKSANEKFNLDKYSSDLMLIFQEVA